MQGWEIKGKGRKLISRAGQSCYVRDRLLCKENEALALPEANSDTASALVAFNSHKRVAKATATELPTSMKES